MTTVIAELVGTLEFQVKGKGLEKFNEGLEQGEKATKSAGVASIAFGNILAKVAAKAAQATVDIVKLGLATGKDLVQDFITSGRELDAWSKKVGVSVEELQRLEFAAESVGAESDNMREAVKTLRENLGELARVGTGPAEDALGTLGIKLDEIKDLGATEQIELLSTALSELPDDAQRISVALEVLGEDGAALLPLFQKGAGGIRALTERADDLGIVLQQSTIDQAVEAGKAVDELALTAKGLTNDLLVGLVPILTEVARRAQAWIGENRELIEQRVEEFIRGIVKAAEFLVEVGGDVVEILSDVDAKFIIITASAIALSLALGGVPGLAVAAGAAIGLAFGSAADSIFEATAALKRFQTIQAGGVGFTGEEAGKFVRTGQESLDAITELEGLSSEELAKIPEEEFERRQEAIIRGSEAAGQAEAGRLVVDKFDVLRGVGLAGQIPPPDPTAFDPLASPEENVRRQQGLVSLAEDQELVRERARRRKRFGRKALAEGGEGVDTRRAEELFAEQLEPLAKAAGLGGKALGASFEAAAQALQRGSNEQVALQAGISSLESLSGVTLAGAGGPDAALFGLLTQIGGPAAARSATEGARFVRIDQSQTNNIEVVIPESFAAALTPQGAAGEFAGALRQILTTEYQQIIDRLGGGIEP